MSNFLIGNLKLFPERKNHSWKVWTWLYSTLFHIVDRACKDSCPSFAGIEVHSCIHWHKTGLSFSTCTSFFHPAFKLLASTITAAAEALRAVNCHLILQAYKTEALYCATAEKIFFDWSRKLHFFDFPRTCTS